MRTNNLDWGIRAGTAATLLAVLLTGCSKPQPQAPQPDPAASEAAPSSDALPPPDASPAAPAQPAPEPPPPTEPSAAPKPSAANEPSVGSMPLAAPSAKLSVAVDLHYSFDGPIVENQPTT